MVFVQRWSIEGGHNQSGFYPSIHLHQVLTVSIFCFRFLFPLFPIAPCVQVSYQSKNPAYFASIKAFSTCHYLNKVGNWHNAACRGKCRGSRGASCPPPPSFPPLPSVLPKSFKHCKIKLSKRAVILIKKSQHWSSV